MPEKSVIAEKRVYNMTPEVKERIDQIRHGIVPEGYIKSKDGIYPGDWTSKKIGQWLQLMERPISLEDEEKYELVTVRRRFGGVDSRGTYLGKNVLVKNYFCLCTGDFVISKRQIAHGACGVVPAELDGAVVSNEYNVFIPQEGTNINIFNLMIQLPHYRRLFYLMSDGVHIEKLLFKTDDWMRRSLAMPSLEEQARIASILTMQDQIIELEQQKIEEIKKTKRFFLEKMFPKEGQAVPEIRFKGFTAPWEQRKLGDIADIVGGGTPSTGNPSYWDGEIDWYAPAEIADQIYANSSQKKITDSGYENSSAKMLPPGTVLFTSRAGIGKTAILIRKGCTNQGFQSIVPHRGELDSYFIFSRTEELKRYGELVGAGSTFVEVSGKQMAEMELMMPPTMREQQTIGGFFRQLDHLITLHQRELAEVGKYKKALMQLLLTGLVRVNA